MVAMRARSASFGQVQLKRWVFCAPKIVRMCVCQNHRFSRRFFQRSSKCLRSALHQLVGNDDCAQGQRCLALNGERQDREPYVFGRILDAISG